MNLQDLIDTLKLIAENHPVLAGQPVSFYYASKNMEFQVDYIYPSVGKNTAKTVINIQ